MSKLKPTLTADVIHSDKLQNWLNEWGRQGEQLEVGDLIIKPIMSGQSAFLGVRVVVEVTEDGRVFVQSESTKKSRLMCPERCLIIGRVK